MLPPSIPAAASAAGSSRAPWPTRNSQSGPRIFTPGQLSNVIDIPDFINSLKDPGYQKAHEWYDEMRDFFARCAYGPQGNAELVVVKVTMMSLKPGKKTPVIISVSIS
jgi:hypothetical protein